MTTNTLAKRYPSLSADERFSLLLAASATGDEVETNRLATSAPVSNHRVSHAFGRSLAFVIVSSIHQMQLLNLTAFFFKATSIADSGTGEKDSKCREGARMFGYLMNIHADAWQVFCKRENLAPKIGTEGMPGEELLEKALEESRLLGFTEAEAQEYCNRPGVSIEHLKTMKDVAGELHDI